MTTVLLFCCCCCSVGRGAATGESVTAGFIVDSLDFGSARAVPETEGVPVVPHPRCTTLPSKARHVG